MDSASAGLIHGNMGGNGGGSRGGNPVLLNVEDSALLRLVAEEIFRLDFKEEGTLLSPGGGGGGARDG